MKRFIKSFIALSLVLMILLEPTQVFAGDKPPSFKSAVTNLGYNKDGNGSLPDNIIEPKAFVELQICRAPYSGKKNTDEVEDIAKMFAGNAPSGINTVASMGYQVGGEINDYGETCTSILLPVGTIYDSNNVKFAGGTSTLRSVAYNLYVEPTDEYRSPDRLLSVAKELNSLGGSYCPSDWVEDIERLINNNTPVEDRAYEYFIAYQFIPVPCISKDSRLYILTNGANAKSNNIGDWGFNDISLIYSLVTWNVHHLDHSATSALSYYQSGGMDSLWDHSDMKHWFDEGLYDETDRSIYNRLWKFAWDYKNGNTSEYGWFYQSYCEPTHKIHSSVGGSWGSQNTSCGSGYWGLLIGDDIPINPTYKIEWSVESKTVMEGADFEDGSDNWGKVAVHFRPGNQKTYDDIKNDKNARFKVTLTANHNPLRMPQVSNDYWAGSGGYIGSSDTFMNVVVSEAQDKVEFQVSSLGMIRLLDGGRILFEDWACPDSATTSVTSNKIIAEHRVTWNMEIECISGALSGESFAAVAGRGAGIDPNREKWDWNGTDGWKTNGTSGSNILSWVQFKNEDIPWHYNSASGGTAYAEVVANEIGNLAQDWSVMGGLPSTENLSVAVGGTSFAVSCAGYITSVGIDKPNERTVKRTIQFVVNIHDIWGTEVSNNPECTLSCPGHTYPVSPTKQQGESTGCTSSWTCPVCSDTQNAAKKNCNENDHSGCNHLEDCALQPTEPGGTVDHTACNHKCEPKCDKQCHYTYNCSKHNSETLTYHCDTGKWDKTGEIASVSVNSTLQHGQAYSSTATITMQYSGDSRTGQSFTYNVPSILCEGYTSKYGCVSNCKTNCVHRITDSRTFYIHEYLDLYAWRYITNAKVYMLTHASITGINTNLLESSALGQSSSNAGLMTDMWRGNGGWVNGQKGQNGRLWFTQFKTPTPTFGSGANTVSVQGYDYNGGLCSTYWLSDCIITIDTYADSTVGNDSNIAVVDDVTISDFNGKNNNNYSSTVESTVETFKQNKGDWLDIIPRTNLATQLVNAWMFKNKSEDYTINVVSDTLFVGIDGGVGGGAVAQDVTADVYAVDDGINIFEEPFTGVVAEAHDVFHKSKYPDPTSLFQSNESNYSNIFKSNAPFMFQGYLGTPAVNASDKYGITGNNVSLNNAFCYALSKSPGGLSRFESKNGVDWSAGSIQSGGGTTAYTRIVGDGTTDKPGRRGIVKLVTEGSTTNETFNGYYRTHNYGTKGSYSVSAKSTESGNSYSSGTIANVTHSGALGLGAYNVPLHMSNLNIKDNIPNGVYNKPVSVTTYMKLVYEMNNDAGQHAKLTNLNAAYSAKYASGYTNSAGQAGVINDVVIHDPISVQYDQLISNNYGSIPGIYSVDESQEDLRQTSENVSNADRANYIVVGNKFYIWSSDLGDFSQPVGWEVNNASPYPGVGSETLGSDVKTGVINSAGRGYTNKMNTEKWIQSRTITFGFPVSYINTSGNKVLVEGYTPIDLSTVKISYTGYANNLCTNSNNTIEGFRNSSNDVQDLEFVYGRMYEFYCIESAPEGTAFIKFDTYAKNNTNNVEQVDLNISRYALSAPHVVTKTVYTDIVGRIGNLAIEDTSDFRYSNMFKETDAGWLIDGVVQNVDSTNPRSIVSTFYNIMGDNAASIKHATYSVTNYDGGGKAGNFQLLPLTSNLNNLTEFKGQELRTGYQLYMDLETIGAYGGYNYKNVNGSNVNDKGPESTDDVTDNRTSKIVIKPRYLLYDYDTQKFYDIDMFCGNVGSYTKFYAASGEVIRNSTAALYVDLENERERRNISAAEYVVTRAVTAQHGAYMVRDALTEKDYIGTASEIVLDAYNRTYIGSSIMNGKVSGGTYTGSGDVATGNTANGGKSLSGKTTYSSNSGNINSKLTDLAFSNAVQRYHFTMGLPSSTVITYPGAGTSQTAIVDSNNKIKAEHPNSVIVCFADIKAYGNVYTLHYDVQQIMGNLVINTPNGTISDYTLPKYNATSKALTKYDVPLFFCDPWYSSTDDLDIFGTH